MLKRFLVLTLLLGLSFVMLAGCGQKGALYLPAQNGEPAAELETVESGRVGPDQDKPIKATQQDEPPTTD